VWNEKTQREISGLALLALALFTLLSLIPIGGDSAFSTGNIMGVVGASFASVARAALGIGAWGLPLLPALWAAAAFDWLERDRTLRFSVLVLGLVILLPITGGLMNPSGENEAGWIGNTLATPLAALLGRAGAWLVLTFLYAGLLVLTLGWNPLTAAIRGARDLRTTALPAAQPQSGVKPLLSADTVDDDELEDNVAVPPMPIPAARREDAKASKKPKKSRVDLEEWGDPESEDRPPLNMLSDPPPQSTSLTESELDRLGQVLIQTLRTFKVEGEIGGRTTGPVVTQFEVVPAPGVKVNRIAALDADLALALKAPSVRIVAPIPGKGAVGVDVPNPERVVVYLRQILESPAFQRKGAQLPMALGQDLAGRPYAADLTKMPHLLIAGATGSGKSICINTLITSLIYRHPPSELRLLLIDPKMVELSMYADLPHLRHPVVTDPHDAATVLKWAVLEMERRYSLLSANGARSITEFNRRVLDGHPLKRAFPSGGENELDHWAYTEGPLPYVVAVVDELADLMMTVQAEIEKPLAQLAQKARAIGIHLIVATQRPSVNVITGLIKANFPCRIAFRVSSKVDSRTILDQNGADALLGNGDMLFLPPGQSDPVRIQGAYVSTEDTERLMAWYRDRLRDKPPSEEDILEYVRAREADEASDELAGDFGGERDALFRQAAEICVQFQQGSTSLLQRRLQVGYGRAARIIDQLHQAGVLGPPNGSKPRDVLVGMESIEHICGDQD
jgi:DNA segregation ATPase FtsK/SpoIIIE, S-DNA-T family